MTDENRSETEEVETQDIQEEPLDELALKDQEIAKLKEDFERQEAETQEYISLSQRLQADFENFKKIIEGVKSCKFHIAELIYLKAVHSDTKCDILMEYEP